MYKIKLPFFEGPFDLLLYFIKRDEINIYDIPIAKLSEEFLNYIKIMQFLDLDFAGEFLVMASTLMLIKTQMLLPRKLDENSEEIEDPRANLVQQLLEYKLYKEASFNLKKLQDENSNTFYRLNFELDKKSAENTNIHYSNASIFDLINVLNKLLNKKKGSDNKQQIIELIPVTVEEKRNLISQLIKKKHRISFFELINNNSINHIVASFLAVLDLLKLQLIYIYQNKLFNDIIITDSPFKEDEN